MMMLFVSSEYVLSNPPRSCCLTGESLPGDRSGRWVSRELSSVQRESRRRGCTDCAPDASVAPV